MGVEIKRLAVVLNAKNADRGEVAAVVATLGVVDRDGDVILPGALPPGGATVKLSGFGHDVVLGKEAPVGKGIIAAEGNRVLFRGHFFMTTERGRQAFLTAKEIGPDGEWSFSFGDVRTSSLTQEWRAKGARRLIAGLTPLDASPVLRSAGIGTGTVMVKAGSREASPVPDRKDLAQVEFERFQRISRAVAVLLAIPDARYR
jgi:hypothetical protein